METFRPETQKEEKTPQQLVEMRLAQSRASRLSEYLIGLRTDDPKILERLTSDYAVIRGKYNLPDRSMRLKDPREFERLIRERAKKIGVQIREKSDCGSFFEEYPGAGAVYDEPLSRIGVSIDRSKLNKYTANLSALEHEFIHAEQHHTAPRMPNEQMEYEAYLAGIDMRMLEISPEDIEEILFGMLIMGSVDTNNQIHQDSSSNPEEKLEPIWDNPEYFLREVDGLDEATIRELMAKAMPTNIAA